MNFELVTLDGIKFQQQVYSVILPTASGEIAVLPAHEPLLTQLVPGIIAIRKTKGDADYHVDHYATYGGVAEITKSGVRVLVDEATHSSEINQAEAQKAHDEAQRLRANAKTPVELDRAQTLVDRQVVRLQVADIRRRHRKQ